MTRASGQRLAAGAGVTDHSRNAWIACALLLLLNLASALAVVASSHQCRTLYEELQTLEVSHWRLQENVGRLLLEQSAWASLQRVDRVATSDLDMHMPALENYRVLGR